MVTRRILLTILGVSLTIGLCPARAAEFNVLKEGSQVPGILLQDQNGKDFRFESLKGHAVVLTFIFSRCAVPTFCPAMSANFRALQEAVRKDDKLKGKVHLVSISIDPSFDTPEVLKRYAEHLSLDTSDWSFVTGEKRSVLGLATAFSVFIDPTADGSIDHTLTTALVGPDGKIRKLWRGNRWTLEEVVRELRATLTPSKHSA